MGSTFSVTIQPARRVKGRVRPPGDKSVSHRYAMLAAIAEGHTVINGYSTGADCASTLACLRGLGVSITETARNAQDGVQLAIRGVGMEGLQIGRAHV